MSTGWESRAERWPARARTPGFGCVLADYAIEDYARALEAAGLAIEAVREPAPAGDAAEQPNAAGWTRWHRLPMFLMLRARKPRA